MECSEMARFVRYVLDGEYMRLNLLTEPTGR